MTPPPPKPTPPFDPPAISIIVLIFFATIITIGCTSSDDNVLLPSTLTIQQTTLPTIEPPPLSIPTTEPTIEATILDQTEIITEIPITIEMTTKPVITKTTSEQIPVDPISIDYLANSDWDNYKSIKGKYIIWHPHRWVIYTGSGVSGYELEEEVTLCYPHPKNSQYNDLRHIIEDVDYDIEIWGFDFKNSEVNRFGYVKYELLSALNYYKATNIQEYSGTKKINGNNATHFTYTLTHVNSKTIGDAYIIQKGTRYYIIAYVGGKVESSEYDRTLILKIIQSFKPI